MKSAKWRARRALRARRARRARSTKFKFQP